MSYPSDAEASVMHGSFGSRRKYGVIHRPAPTGPGYAPAPLWSCETAHPDGHLTREEALACAEDELERGRTMKTHAP